MISSTDSNRGKDDLRCCSGSECDRRRFALVKVRLALVRVFEKLTKHESLEDCFLGLMSDSFEVATVLSQFSDLRDWTYPLQEKFISLCFKLRENFWTGLKVP